MSKLEPVVLSIVELFDTFSVKEGKKGQLSYSELGELLQQELSHPEFKKKFNPDDVEEVMKELDQNHDQQINFREFCKFVTDLARACRKAQKEARQNK